LQKWQNQYLHVQQTELIQSQHRLGLSQDTTRTAKLDSVDTGKSTSKYPREKSLLDGQKGGKIKIIDHQKDMLQLQEVKMPKNVL
jgi:hypothetical protein